MANGMIEMQERITRVEERLEYLDKDAAERREEQRDAAKDISDRLRSLEEALHKNQGFWGAVVLIGGAVATAATMFWDVVKVKLFGS